ncbi:hypothetical protein D9M68_827180 [compost metagenome]
MLATHGKGRLHKGKIGVVGHHGFREDRELNAFATQFKDLPADLVDSAFAAVEHRAKLHGGGTDGRHVIDPVGVREGPSRAREGWGGQAVQVSMISAPSRRISRRRSITSSGLIGRMPSIRAFSVWP